MAICLYGSLSNQIAAHRERGKQLIVQIVPVGQYHQRGIGHRRVLDQLSSVKRHQQALSDTDRAMGGLL